MDWKTFLIDHTIEYVERGPNTKRGEISIQCPFCGPDDPSHHMGISLRSDNWGCLRASDHRGKSAARLISALLSCSHTRALNVLRQYSVSDPDSLADVINMFDPTPVAPSTENAPVSLPDEFRPILKSGLTGKFWQYLAKRGFDNVGNLIDKYKLICAITGRFKDRVIVPFYEDGRLIGWTGRAIINPVGAPRYLSSGAAVKETIFNVDQVNRGGTTLVVVEGPFDALKLDFFGQLYGVSATCVFGTSITPSQISLINKAAQKYKQTYILFDPEAIEASFNATDWFIGPRITVTQLPDGIEDPGAMSGNQVADFCKTL